MPPRRSREVLEHSPDDDASSVATVRPATRPALKRIRCNSDASSLPTAADILDPKTETLVAKVVEAANLDQPNPDLFKGLAFLLERSAWDLELRAFSVQNIQARGGRVVDRVTNDKVILVIPSEDEEAGKYSGIGARLAHGIGPIYRLYKSCDRVSSSWIVKCSSQNSLLPYDRPGQTEVSSHGLVSTPRHRVFSTLSIGHDVDNARIDRILRYMDAFFVEKGDTRDRFFHAQDARDQLEGFKYPDSTKSFCQKYMPIFEQCCPAFKARQKLAARGGGKGHREGKANRLATADSRRLALSGLMELSGQKSPEPTKLGTSEASFIPPKAEPGDTRARQPSDPKATSLECVPEAASAIPCAPLPIAGGSKNATASGSGERSSSPSPLIPFGGSTKSHPVDDVSTEDDLGAAQCDTERVLDDSCDSNALHATPRPPSTLIVDTPELDVRQQLSTCLAEKSPPLQPHVELVRYALGEIADFDDGQLGPFLDDYGHRFLSSSAANSLSYRYVDCGSLLGYSRSVLKRGSSHEDAWLESMGNDFIASEWKDAVYISPLKYAQSWSLLAIDVVAQTTSIYFTHPIDVHDARAGAIFGYARLLLSHIVHACGVSFIPKSTSSSATAIGDTSSSVPQLHVMRFLRRLAQGHPISVAAAGLSGDALGLKRDLRGMLLELQTGSLS